MTIYYAHPTSTYGTQSELDDIAAIVGDVLNPNTPEHAAGYAAHGMRYFFDEVLPRCSSCVLRVFDDGKIGAGVYAEAMWFVERGMPVSEICGGRIAPWLPDERRRLTVDETRARIAAASSEVANGQT